MPKDGRKAGIIGGLAAAGVGVFLLLKKKPPVEPEPPEPGLASPYGTVTNRETGEAIPNALVTLNGYSARTDSYGYYSFESLELGGYTITIEKEGYDTISSDITLVEGINEWNVTMVPEAPPGNLVGRVTDAATGQGIPSSEVVVGINRTYTDSNGNYSFTDLETGSYAISASKPFYEDFGFVGLIIMEGNNEFNIELTPVPVEVLVSLTGLVTDAQGRPIEGAKVSLDGAIPKDEGYTTIFTNTNSGGEYSFEGLEPRNYTITFEKEGYKPVTRNIAVLEDTYDEQSLALLPPTDVVLHFTNPRFKYGFWDLKWRNLGESGWKSGEPFGAKAQDIPCTFSPELEFLLQIMEWDGTTGACWLGPYLVEIPGLGDRTWNSRAGAISGGSVIELTATDNECIISGILEAVNWGEAGWGATILVDGAEDVPGKENIGEFFIGDRISSQELATLPRHGETGSLVIETGRRIICNANLFMQHIYPDTKRPNWKLWNFRYYPEYPPEAYEFAGSLSWGEIVEKGWYVGIQGGTPIYSPGREILYQISGTVSPFAIVIMGYNQYGSGMYAWPEIGPSSGTVMGHVYGSATMFAHPNPNAKWGLYTWRLDNWQVVAGIQLRVP